MKVSQLLRRAHLPKPEIDHEVFGLTDDSRFCYNNAVYVALNGAKVNGEEFIDHAIQKGARTIVTSTIKKRKKNINYILVEDTRRALAALARIYYRNVSRKLKLIGVLGTNGKTTTSTLGYAFFEHVHRKSMLIGSNGVFYKDYKAELDNTTPSILTLYHYLTVARRKGIKYVFMEVSSISVDQLRVAGLDFSVLIFTNFSEDHLDYHKTMDAYFQCKSIPFLQLKRTGTAIINKDDAMAVRLCKHLQAKCITYGFVKKSDYYGTKGVATEDGTRFFCNNFMFKSPLLGAFNLYNELAVLALCEVFHIEPLHYVDFLGRYESVDGRMNKIEHKKRTILVDYAHTEVAVRKAVVEALNICKGTLFVIVGCGGNREREKRSKIGSDLNDLPIDIVLTTDNPRDEEPLAIIEDIKQGLTRDVTVIEDRKEAILYVLHQLKEQDMALILGKGCENYMEIKGVKYPYSDLEVIHEWIRGC